MKYDPIQRGPSSGIVVPLQSLRSAHSPAAGEFPDLAALGSLATSWGFDLVQLLPVNDSGYQTSPYSALSAFALHPLYLSVAALPELAGGSASGLPAAPALVGEAAALASRYAADARFRYGAYLDEKLALLEKIWKSAAEPALAKGGRDSGEFDVWMAANPWVKAYAVFVELKRVNAGKPWWEWADLREPTAADIERLWADKVFASGCRFRAWLQWRAEGQFKAAVAALEAAGIALMGDIPIMINEDSADVWARRSVFRLGLSAGAPPDMYAELGQNWGFPIYDWDAAEKDGFSFWKERLASAGKFYSAYRIDHVLGFFRIWALSARERSGYLGRFVPDAYIGIEELERAGFSRERIRWLSEPHIPASRIVEACGGDAEAAAAVEALALDRIGNEDLFLFKRTIAGERDIEELVAAKRAGRKGKAISDAAKAFLVETWRDRALHEIEPGLYVPAWRYYNSRAWPTLSDEERRRLESLFAAKRAEGEAVWEGNGRRLLGVLAMSSAMLPCAEDLGSVPACVPKVLGDLGILGLRVLRWTREWDRPGQPYIEAANYPRLTIACPSVHDSTSTRDWYEHEADKAQVWALAGRSLGEDLGPAPEHYDPKAASVLLRAVARTNSAVAVYPIQDLLALGMAFRPANPGDERVNVPGTSTEWNWGWRLPATLEAIAADADLAKSARKVARAKR
jgi:4-alpha-glucanotransferase